MWSRVVISETLETLTTKLTKKGMDLTLFMQQSFTARLTYTCDIVVCSHIQTLQHSQNIDMAWPRTQKSFLISATWVITDQRKEIWPIWYPYQPEIFKTFKIKQSGYKLCTCDLTHIGAPFGTNHSSNCLGKVIHGGLIFCHEISWLSVFFF